MIAEPNMKDVGEFVPERHAQSAGARDRAHGRQLASKTDSRDGRLREPACAYGKLIPRLIDFNTDRRRWFVTVARHHYLVSFGEKGRNIPIQERRLGFRQSQLKRPLPALCVVDRYGLLVEIERVENPHIVRIEFKGTS